MHRNCGICDTSVHDLDAMGPEAANKLLDASPGKLCVRKTFTRELNRPSPASRRQALVYVASLAITSLAACTPRRKMTTLTLESRRESWYSPEREEAEAVLLAAGWTPEEIRAETVAHRLRRNQPDHQPPPPDTEEAKLYALLEVISRSPGPLEDLGQPAPQTFVGRRN